MRSPNESSDDSPGYPFDETATARAVVDGDGILVEWNEGARRLLGHTPAEVVGRPAANLLAPDSGAPLPRRPTAAGTRHSRCATGTAGP